VLVWRFLTAPDSVLVMVMFTLGNDAPEGSVVIVRTMVACCANAQQEKARATAKMGRVDRRKLHFRAEVGGYAPTSLKRIESDLKFIYFSP
jgi:hypothetical protein